MLLPELGERLEHRYEYDRWAVVLSYPKDHPHTVTLNDYRTDDIGKIISGPKGYIRHIPVHELWDHYDHGKLQLARKKKTRRSTLEKILNRPQKPKPEDRLICLKEIDGLDMISGSFTPGKEYVIDHEKPNHVDKFGVRSHKWVIKEDQGTGILFSLEDLKEYFDLNKRLRNEIIGDLLSDEK